MDYREWIEGEVRVLVFMARPECQRSRKGDPWAEQWQALHVAGCSSCRWHLELEPWLHLGRQKKTIPHLPTAPSNLWLIGVLQPIEQLWAFEKEKENFWFSWEPTVNSVKEFNLSVQLHVGLMTAPFGKYLKKRRRVLISPPLSNI